MQKREIEKHISSYPATFEDIKTDGPDDEELLIKTLPVNPRALVHDVVQFDLSCLTILHKLGEGK